jgi:hypothetical protein
MTIILAFSVPILIFVGAVVLVEKLQNRSAKKSAEKWRDTIRRH